MKQDVTVIKSQNHLFQLNLKEIWNYRDLIRMYVKRDIVVTYKQTILGPAWFVLQPILTTIMFMLVFGRVAGISTDGIPQPLFYYTGLMLWTYFADCLNRNSRIFIDNQAVFGKVYFPRMVVPISVTISNLVRFSIQFGIFVLIYLYYFFNGTGIGLNAYAFLFPVLLCMVAGLSLGFGIIISSMTTKYRDLTFLLQFGVQLWMYATPIIYPLRMMPEKIRWLLYLNPMTSIEEAFKYGMIGTGIFSWGWLAYSFVLMVVLLLFGILIFNRVEKSFMDTV